MDPLERAQRDYPIGTKYHALSILGNEERRVHEAERPARWLDRKKDSIDVGVGYVYVKKYDGEEVWARLVESPELMNYAIF